MKRSTTFFIGLVVVAFIVYKLTSWGEVGKWFGSIAKSLPSSTSTMQVITGATSTASAVTFDQDRSKPYVLNLQSGSGKSALTWVLTVDAPIGGYAFDGTNTYEAYGEVVTSTDQIVLSAYAPDGDVLATATGTWKGQGFTGTVLQAGKTSDLSLLPSAVSTTRMSFVHGEDRWEQKKPDMGCEFSLTMPVIQAGNGVSVAAAERMNRTIRAAFLRSAAQYLDFDTGKTSGAQTVDQARAAFMQSCRTQLNEERQSWKGSVDEVGGMFQRSVDISVRVTYNQPGWLSFTSDLYGYSGGAHGNTLRRTFVFNTRTGEAQELSDIIRPDAQALFMQRVGRLLLAQYQDGLFEDSAAPIRAFVDADATRAQTLYRTGASGFSTSTAFYLLGQNVNVVFQQYELTPYAVGIPEVSLPYASWSDLTVASNDPFAVR